MIYSITIPKEITSSGDLLKDKYIKDITDLLDKYEIEWCTCDTMPGWFSLNQEWVQTKDFEGNTEWDNSMPNSFNEKDCDVITRLVNEGKIVIMVDELNDEGIYEPRI